jgi:hypothetical protein
MGYSCLISAIRVLVALRAGGTRAPPGALSRRHRSSWGRNPAAWSRGHD